MGQRNCTKHVEFYSKNKFEKLVHLFGFIIRIYHDARSYECQKKKEKLTSKPQPLSLCGKSPLFFGKEGEWAQETV